MPDHIHLVLTPADSTTLEKAVQLIKGGSSREIGKRPGMRFPVWHVGFTEHQIRDQRDFDLHAQYMDNNPVKAHLAALPNEYLYGSAAGKFVLDAWTMASGAKAHALTPTLRRDWKSRPSNSSSNVG
jgi:putative transposase